MQLNEKKIKAAKPEAKRRRLSDGHGLFLEVMPSGAKFWRQMYRNAQGQQRTYTLGEYPHVGLADARARLHEVKQAVREGGDPAQEARTVPIEDKAIVEDAAVTFGTIGRAFLEKRNREGAASQTMIKNTSHFGRLDTAFGSVPARDVTPAMVLAVCREAEALGHTETSHRIRALAGRVFRYGIAEGHEGVRDIASELSDALVKHHAKNHAAITNPERVGGLIRAVSAYGGYIPVRYGLVILAHTFLRPGEVRYGEWSEIDWERRIWAVPAQRMKMKDAHLVPLTEPTLAALKALFTVTGTGKYLLPSIRHKDRVISDNTFNAALRDMGYPGSTHVSHGFRTTASTTLYESNEFDGKWIEKQLAHEDNRTVRGIYNKAQYWEGRCKMMEWYSDWLEVQAFTLHQKGPTLDDVLANR
jgi:integrase